MKAAFQGVSVRDLMTPREDLHTVSTNASVAELMRRMFTERHTGYPVLNDGTLVGLVTLDDARDVREVERDAYTVDDVMSEDLRTVTPDTDAMTAINEMQEHGIGRLLVVDESGDLVGLISRTDLMTAFNIIQETGSLEPTRRADRADERGPANM
jgi:CBS domain-containing protein